MSNKKFFYVLLGMVLLIGLLIFFLSISRLSIKPITSFEECVKVPGNKILLTYPEQCLTSDGKKFVDQKNIDMVNPASQFCGSSTKGKCATNTDCITGGCSGQICQSASEESIISTCEYQDCYDAQKFGLSCRCLNQQCQWAK